jgi:hypothetical protein
MKLIIKTWTLNLAKSMDDYLPEQNVYETSYKNVQE